jgi:hypothetical protein
MQSATAACSVASGMSFFFQPQYARSKEPKEGEEGSRFQWDMARRAKPSASRSYAFCKHRLQA